jgi:hypothetical protein
MTSSFQIKTKRATIIGVHAFMHEDKQTGELTKQVKVKLSIGLSAEVLTGASIEIKADNKGSWKHRMKRLDLSVVTVRIGDLYFADAKPIGKSIAIQDGAMEFTYKCKATTEQIQALIGMLGGRQAVEIASMEQDIPGLDGADALRKAAAEFDALGVEVEVRYAE